MFIKLLEQVRRRDSGKTGGKGTALGEMMRLKFPVPSGFVVTAEAFIEFHKKSINSDFKTQLLQFFDNLHADRVAVRSSAVGEDSLTASWAGQLESYLNVDRENLISKIKKCWDSIKAERVLQYVSEKNVPQDKLLVAVIVQKMIASEASGVMFTINPITNNRSEIMIEAGFGLGEMIVAGKITPCNLILDKKTLRIKSQDIQTQDTMLVFRNGRNVEIPVPENIKNKHVISDESIKKLGEIAIKIEKHYQTPQDIEFAIDKENKIWILQSRPVTTM